MRGLWEKGTKEAFRDRPGQGKMRKSGGSCGQGWGCGDLGPHQAPGAAATFQGGERTGQGQSWGLRRGTREGKGGRRGLCEMEGACVARLSSEGKVCPTGVPRATTPEVPLKARFLTTGCEPLSFLVFWYYFFVSNSEDSLVLYNLSRP